MIVILASTSTGLVGVVGRRITSPEILGFGGVYGVTARISTPFHVQRILLFMLFAEFCLQCEYASSFVMLAVEIKSLPFINPSYFHLFVTITSPEILGFDGVTPKGVLLITVGVTGLAGTLYIRERKILDTSASCIPGFANISTLPTLMTPSTHVSIMVDFCIFIEKKTRYKKEKREWREEHLFKSTLCYPIISWLSKFMN